MASSSTLKAPATAGADARRPEFDPEVVVARERSDRLRRRRRDRIVQYSGRVLLAVLLVLGWEWYASRTTPLILPSLGSIWDATWAARDAVREDALFTLRQSIVGFILGAGIGFLLGVALAHSVRFEAIVRPFVVASQAVPKVALAPLFMVWFGYGGTPKMVIAALVSFFPVLENTVVGLRRVDPAYLRLFRAAGASRFATFRRLRLVSAAPYILTGARVSVVMALMGVIVGEFIAGNQGLGASVLAAQGRLQIQLMFGLIIVLTTLGLVLYAVVRMIEAVILRRLHVASDISLLEGTS